MYLFLVSRVPYCRFAAIPILAESFWTEEGDYSPVVSAFPRVSRAGSLSPYL